MQTSTNADLSLSCDRRSRQRGLRLEEQVMRSIAALAALLAVPTFRLGYRIIAPDRLSVWFGMARPGGGDFRAIATGELRKRS
jgi:hypothetical protein